MVVNNDGGAIFASLEQGADEYAAERRVLVMGFARELVARYGVAADVAIHAPHRDGDQRNHHAHLMLTTRRLGADGLTEKTRELDDRVQGPQQIQAIRALWEQEQNLALERAQSPERVTCQSLAAQGIQRVPQEKIGEKFKALGRQGVSPRVCGDWQEVARRHRASRARPKHRFEREAVARKSAMRQAMERQAATRRGQRGPEIEQAKASAVAWALDAAGKVIDARDEPSAQLVRLQRQQERERAELAARHFELRAKLEAAPVTPRQQLLGTANQLMKQRRKAVESAERERRAMEKAHRLQREEFAKRNPLVPEQTSGKVKTNSQDFGLD